MFNIPKAIKGFTYVQSTDPISKYSVVNSDTWFNSSDNSMLIRHNGRWIPFILSSYYGYVSGGIGLSAAPTSVIDRITFPFDSGTSSAVGSVYMLHIYGAGCNSSNYGYSLGSYSGPNYSGTIIQRINFPFNSGTSINVGNLSDTRMHNFGSFNSSNYGFCVDGVIYNIDRITFPFNSGTSITVGSLVGTYEGTTGGVNSSNYGYSKFDSAIERILFPFNSGTASAVGVLAIQRTNCNSCNSSTAGYYIGSEAVAGPAPYPNDKVVFPFNSGTSILVGNTNTSISGAHCAFNSSNFGYNINRYNSSIERMLFPFDSGTAIITGNLTRVVEYSSGIDETDFNMMFL